MQTFVVECEKTFWQGMKIDDDSYNIYWSYFLIDDNSKIQAENTIKNIFGCGDIKTRRDADYTDWFYSVGSIGFNVYTIDEFVDRLHQDRFKFKYIHINKRTLALAKKFIEEGVPIFEGDYTTLFLVDGNNPKIINVDTHDLTSTKHANDVYDYDSLENEEIMESRRISPRGRKLLANRRLSKRPNRLVESFEISPSGMDSLLAGLNSYNVDDHIPFNEDSELSELARQIKKNRK